MVDFHPSIKSQTTFHHLLPGYNYSLQDPSDAFYARQQVAFLANQLTYSPNVQAMVSIANNEAFLDVDNSYMQCIVTYPTAQFAANDTANSDMGGWVMDQLASSIVNRILVKAGGQTLTDFQYFNDYHHVKVLSEDTDCEQMDFFSEDDGISPSIGVGGADAATISANLKNYTPAATTSTTELKKYISLYGRQQTFTRNQADDANVPTGYYLSMDELIQERLKEDIKRAMKCWRLETAIGVDQTTNINCFYSPRPNSDMETYKILFKLSDLPCFSSKMYFPLFALNGPIQFQIYWQPFEDCHHYIGFARGVAAPDVGSQTYTVERLEIVCSLIYPKPDYIDQYMLNVVAPGQGFYKCEYVDFGDLNLPSQNSTLLYNVSLARLTKSVYLRKDFQNQQQSSTKRYTLSDSNAERRGLFNYRGNKWYNPWGQINQIYTRVNGITFPQANGSILINEHLIKEQTEEVLGKLIGLKDPRRFFFDQQILAFSYKKDTHSNQLMDVSGVNTANNNQLQLVINLADPLPTASDIHVYAFHHGEMITQFTPSGALLMFR